MDVYLNSTLHYHWMRNPSCNTHCICTACVFLRAVCFILLMRRSPYHTSQLHVTTWIIKMYCVYVMTCQFNICMHARCALLAFLFEWKCVACFSACNSYRSACMELYTYSCLCLCHLLTQIVHMLHPCMHLLLPAIVLSFGSWRTQHQAWFLLCIVFLCSALQLWSAPMLLIGV